MMMIASNAVAHLHDEHYADPFDRRNLDHRCWLFVGGRKAASLDGIWRFTPDLFEEGLRQHWYRAAPRDEAARTSPWDGDPDTGYRMRVPSCWNLARKEWAHFEGSAWYSRRFRHRAGAPGERVFLRVGAANYDTRVFLNGVFLGNHVGGSTPFFCELTAGLQDDNRLDLCVNNERRATRVPTRHFDWFNYGGIHRSVALFRVPAVHIRDAHVRLGDHGIAIDVELSDESATGDVRIRIPELRIDSRIAAVNGRAAGVIAATPALWSPRRPVLHDVEIAFGEDRVRDRVGFRRIAIDGRDIMLNGEPILLKGACVHEDDLATGRVTGEADIRRRMRHIRELSGNFLRLAHYPHDERVARIADEEGVLLWAEIPVYWAVAFADPATYRDAENQLVELIRRDRNRASVIIWGVGNENADTDARLAFMSGLAACARRWDPARLVSAACLVNKKARRIEDRLVPHLDVIGINEYYGWYEPDVADLLAIGRNSTIDRPVVITEVGAEAPCGRRGAAGVMFTENKMVEVYRAQTQAIAACDWIVGMSAWILYDFRSERRQNRHQRGFNRKGLIAADKRSKKRAFGVLRDFYRDWSRGNWGGTGEG
jgi:beta-glucuronidase